jgi:glycerol-3-phosphate acyltransferase PlsX
MMACGLFVLGRLPGVERPAIVTTFPTQAGECALLDMGANVETKPAVLAQFGVLGSVYARLLHGKARPKVGLLSNGSEEHKGTALTREAHHLLARAGSAGAADFSYVGYVEGRDIFKGEVDVVVTDGFTGNVVLKSVEGAAEAILAMVREEVAREGLLAKLGAALMTKALRRLKRRTDYAEHGGALLLGVDGVALICHGGSNAIALKNAVYVADRFAQMGFGHELGEAVARHAFLWESVPPPAPKAEAVS